MNRQEFERLVEMTLADGQLTEQEQKVLIQRANEIGISPDELQVIIAAKYQEKTQREQREQEQARMQATTMAAVAAQKPQSGGVQKASVRKCPECGATLTALASRCPECGAEIIGNGDSKGTGIEKFADLLCGSTSLDERINIIKYSVIPTEKMELINYLTFCYAQITETFSGTGKDLNDRMMVRKAWRQKINEALLKSELLFRNDKESQGVVENIRQPFNKKMKELDLNYKLYIILRYVLLALAAYFFYLACFENGELFIYTIFSLIAFFVLNKKCFNLIRKL